MQNAAQSSSSDILKEKESTPQSSPTGSGTDPLDLSRPKFISDSSESEEDDVSEVESFMIDHDLDVDERLDGSKFLLSSACAEAEGTVDPETQARLEALLEAAGIGRLSAADGKHLADPDVLRRLTSSVSCALDEAAAALTRMRTDHPRPAPTDTRSLVEACSDGDVSTVRKLLTEGKSVHETTEEGESLLSLACSAGYLELAQVLLAMHANVEDRGVKGDCTPLMEAASAGHVEIVALLLNHAAEVNAQSSSGNTALMYACAGGHEEVVKVLLECAANVEDHNENGHTPLMEAASAGHVGVARILLEYGAGINTHSNEFKESALTLACYKGHLDMVRFLLEAGADQEHKTDEMHTALMEASMDGHVEVARLLLDSGAQVNMPADSFESPLTLAACGGHTELAVLLIERGANIEEVNDEGYTPLMEAAREGHEDMVALLLTQGANINAQTEETQETALTLACCGGFLEVADFLLKAGADLELGASTPLMEAAQEGHLELVRYLLEFHHANVNAQTQTGDTALTYACENGHTEVAALLLHYGADLEHESEGGRTPLMKACRAGHTYTVQFLISKNADVNKTTTNNDHTPLSLAAAGGHQTVVETLLANCADPFHRLKDNSTMLIEAAKGGHTSVVHLLLDYPHSIMMQQPAETEASRVAPVLEETPSTAQAQTKPSVQPQRSLLRKLRTAPCAEPPVLTSAEVQQVRNQPIGESIADVEPTEPDKPIEADPAVAIAAVETVQPIAPPSLWEVPIQCPTEVSQNTAISDRPKAKAFKREGKDGKATRKMLTQQQQMGQIVQSFPVPPPPGQDTSVPPSGVQSETVVQDGTGNVFHVEPTSKALLHHKQTLWMLQQQAMVSTDANDPLLIAAMADVESSYKVKDDQIENIVMDFTHKLDTLSLDDVTNAEQQRLTLRPSQQLFAEESLSEEAIQLLTQRAQGQDVTYIVPLSPQPNERTDSSLQVQYGYTAAHHLVGQPLQLSGANGQPITVTRTNEGNIQITGPGPSLQAMQAKLDYYSGFADGLQLTTAGSLQLTSPTAITSSAAGNTPGGLPVVPGIPPAIASPASSIRVETSTQAYCCVEPTPPVRPPVTCTQVQVATQTTLEKKAVAGAGGKKKVRFPAQVRHHAPTYPPPAGQSDAGLAQCPGAFGAVQCGGPPQPPLLSACMDVDSETDSNHDTALTLACAGGHEELVELLLSRGADIEHRDKKGFTPLILAATAGHEKVVEILLNHGADIEAQSERTKDTPLSLACSGGRYEVVELLLNKGANKEHRNVSDYTPLSLAASGGYVNIIKLLLNHGAEINSRTGSKLGISPLMLASMNGHVAAVKLLLDMGSDINAQIETNRNTALTLACFQGRHEVVSLLLDRKANVEHRAKTGLTPLMEAASGGYVDVGRVLIDKGADVNAAPVPSSRDTALTIAADKGHVRFVELLLSKNAQVEVKNKKGNSPLWLAANGGHSAVVELLYKLDADIDSQDNRKVSCLMAAFRKGHVKVVKWMVNHVTQFPSDQEMTRYIATVSDKELLDKCHECVKIIRAAKDLQSAKANKNASILLEELDMEKTREESKKAAAARRRERKKKKKLEKKEERRKLFEENKKQEPESEDEDEEEDTRQSEEVAVERLSSSSPVPVDKEEGDSGIDANSQGSCSSNDTKPKEATNKRKEKKKKKGAAVADKSNEVHPHRPTDSRVIVSSSLVEVAEESKPMPNLHIRLNKILKAQQHEVAQRLMMELRDPPRHPADREDFEATGNETYVPANKSRTKNNNNYNYQNHHEEVVGKGATTNTSPKGAGKREEGWKEVVRNFPYRSKKVSVPLNAISRVIGRGGSNINAIRSATGAHIEVEKQGKGQGERIITIKGSADATKQAHNLIAVLIKDPEVDIQQMLPKSTKAASSNQVVPTPITTWEKPPATVAPKTKTATTSSGKPAVVVTSTYTVIAKPSTSSIGNAIPARTSTAIKLNLTQPQPAKLAPFRLVTAPDPKRSSNGSTKTTMSYTSVIMTSGRGSKTVQPNTAGTPGPSHLMSMGNKPRGAPFIPPQAPATAPVSPQVSPPQPMPPSPKHHRAPPSDMMSSNASRPQPTASAPPNMQGQFASKPPSYPPPHVVPHPPPRCSTPQQQELISHLQSEYSLFNDSFSKNSMWGREEANKLNFASVAATGAPTSGPSKFLEEPTQVDLSKAPGYRGNTMCSPVGSKHAYCTPNYPEPPVPSLALPRVSDGQNISPRGGEQAVCAPMGMMPAMQLQEAVVAPPSAAPGPIGPPMQMFSARGAYTDPVMYQSELGYAMPNSSPPPPSVAMSRLNPRAPDFAYANRWPYVQDGPVVFPNPSVNDLLTTSFDNGISQSPAISPSSPMQPGLAPGDIKGEDRKIPRPIGTERNWKNNNNPMLNGFDMDQSWIDAKSWQQVASFRPNNPQFRLIPEELTLIDPSLYQGSIADTQFHNGAALAQQIMMAQQQIPIHSLPAIDPGKIDPANWDVTNKHDWTTNKWSH